MERNKIPRRLPFLFVPDGVLLPGASMRFLINTPRNMAMVKSRLLSRSSLSSTVVGILPFDPIGPRELGQAAEPDLSEVQNRIGSAAVVVQVTGTNWPKPAYSLLVTGLCRISVDQVVQETPFPIGMVQQIESLRPEGSYELSSPELHNKMEEFKEKALILLELLDSSLPAVNRLKKMLGTVPTIQLADMVSAIVKASYGERLDILNSVSIEERFEKAFPLLERQIEGLKITRAKVSKREEGRRKKEEVQRGVARITDQDGSEDWLEFEDDGSDEIVELEARLKEAGLPSKALKAAAREFKRLKKMSPQMPEYPMLRHYLELVAELPWNKTSQESINIKKARSDLDADHYSLDAVKRRILEYLAVRKLNPSLRGPILCFAGPPGVGKTSIAKSIASTLGREFHRISLGGVSDQSDIRGHRRTYIGSMPGRLIQGLKTVGVKNPVFLLDEVDKMSAGMHGDPAAALLEVLDPEQNSNFIDHYLNVPFDLSQVLFIATANNLRNISRPLLDRMEIISVAGYSFEDKLPIATRHLLPRQLGEHGLKDTDIEINENTLKDIVSKYTREAGVRTLERKLGALCRAVAVKLAEENNADLQDESGENDSIEAAEPLKTTLDGGPLVIDDKFVEKVLGQAIFDDALGGRLGVPGVAVGMAWTSVGGETMIVEASRIPCSRGEGRLEVTGQLGSVMRESATLALSWIRSHATPLGLDGAEIIANHDIHLHFPEGAVQKDGPSAGVTITTALVSLFTERLVRNDMAMTGEISLRGLVLTVGGVRDKVLAAHRAGLDTIILPKMNLKDIKEIPENIQEKMEFIGVETLEEVLQAAFPSGFPLIMDEEYFKKLSKL